MKFYDQSAPKRNFEAKTTSISNKFLIGAAVFFVILIILILIYNNMNRPSGIFKTIILLSAIFTQLLAVFSMLVQLIKNIEEILYRRSYVGELCRQEFLHDIKYSKKLATYSLEALDAADQWLEQKIKRLERRQLRFFGGPDKLAIIALIVGGWAAWKEVGSEVMAMQFSPLLFGAAFIVGLALGGVLVGQVIEKLCYYRDLIKNAKAISGKSQKTQ